MDVKTIFTVIEKEWPSYYEFKKFYTYVRWKNSNPSCVYCKKTTYKKVLQKPTFSCLTVNGCKKSFDCFFGLGKIKEGLMYPSVYPHFLTLVFLLFFKYEQKVDEAFVVKYPPIRVGRSRQKRRNKMYIQKIKELLLSDEYRMLFEVIAQKIRVLIEEHEDELRRLRLKDKKSILNVESLKGVSSFDEEKLKKEAYLNFKKQQKIVRMQQTKESFEYLI